MPKTPWEARVGVLIDPRLHPLFVYSYKPYDSPFYGGQPRIDWHATDYIGRYWMIEVKSLPLDRKSINLDKDVTPGQRDGLSSVATTVLGVPLLVVGQDKTLYLFSWRKIILATFKPLLPLADADLKLPWSAKAWREYDLIQALESLGIVFNLEMVKTVTTAMGLGPPPTPTFPVFPPGMLSAGLPMPGPGIPPMPPGFGPPWLAPPAVLSPSTSKPKGSIRMRRKKLL